MLVWPVITWWTLFMLFLLVGVPMADWLFADDSEAVAGLAIPLAVVAFTIPVYWLGHLSLGVTTLFVGVAIIIGLSELAGRNGLGVSTRGIIEVATVFTVAYSIMVLAQASSSGINPIASERFLDYGLFRTLLRASALPPEDLWFAGRSVRYYYGGHFIASLFARLTLVPGRYAYALALAGFYAMELTAVYGLSGVLADAQGIPRRRAAVTGAFLFGIASNLVTPVRVLSPLLPEGIRRGLIPSDRSGGIYDTIAESSLALDPSAFDYWSATRVIPGTINEFPLFAYLHGDLHAHMTSIAVTLVAVSILYGYYVTPPERRRHRLVLLFVALPAVTGVVITVNPWSFPTLLGLTLLTVAAAPSLPASIFVNESSPAVAADTGLSGMIEELQRVLIAVVVTIIIGGLAVIWAYPFIDQVLLELAGGRGIGLFPNRTRLVPFLLVHGAFLVIFWAYLSGTFADRFNHLIGAGLLLIAFALLGGAADLVGLALMGPLIGAGWIRLRNHQVGYETILLVAGAGLVFLVEFVYLANAGSAGRGNTLFKAYMQAWTVWAIAGGVVVASMTTATRTSWPITPERRALFGRGILVLLVVSLSLYGVLFVFSPGSYFERTETYSLDALQYARATHPVETEAIEWLDDLEGKPTMVSKPGVEWYTWESVPSSLTGIPTVVGSGREKIYRSARAYNRRAADVAIIYNTTDSNVRAWLLRKYEVDYIYVSPRERSYYRVASFADEPGITVAFENEAVTIYAVNRSVLSE